MEHPVFKKRPTLDFEGVKEAIELLRSVGAIGADFLPDDAFDPREIRQAIKARRMRSQFFGNAFQEPGWDLLLDLFAAELENRRVSVTSACVAAAAAPTTSLRWIGKFIDAGLIGRNPDPRDRRQSFLTLTESGSLSMRKYITALRRAGIAIG